MTEFNDKLNGSEDDRREAKHWITFCDELILASGQDQELRMGLAWLDKRFNDGGKLSMYEILWRVIFTNPKRFVGQENNTLNMESFMKGLTRKEKI